MEPSTRTPTGLSSMLLRALLGSSCCLLLLLSAFFGVVLFTPPFLPAALLWPTLFSSVAEVMVAFWHVFAVAVYELVFGVKVLVFGKVRRSVPGECVLAIMNHRTRIDWLFFFSYQLRFGSLKNLKIFLKDFLKYVPGCGWAMQTVVFPFLRRRWAQDSGLMASRFRYYKAVGSRPHLLLFPEGTDLTPQTLQASDSFAAKTGLPPLRYVLHPRTTGFVFTVRQLRQLGLMDKVLDVTVAYPGGVPRGEGDLVRGDFPREVHFHVEELEAASLPHSDSELELWCRDRWLAKEEKLRQFYCHKSFREPELTSRPPTERQAAVRMYVAATFWVTFVVLTSALLVATVWMRLYLTVSSCLLLVLDLGFGGLDDVLVRFAAWNRREKSLNPSRLASNGDGS